MAMVEDLLMLAMAIAIAAVALVCVLVALYLWALKHRRESDGGRGSSGTEEALESEDIDTGPPPTFGPGGD